jgi:hypothetical protein
VPLWGHETAQSPQSSLLHRPHTTGEAYRSKGAATGAATGADYKGRRTFLLDDYRPEFPSKNSIGASPVSADMLNRPKSTNLRLMGEFRASGVGPEGVATSAGTSASPQPNTSTAAVSGILTNENPFSSASPTGIKAPFTDDGTTTSTTGKRPESPLKSGRLSANDWSAYTLQRRAMTSPYSSSTLQTLRRTAMVGSSTAATMHPYEWL